MKKVLFVVLIAAVAGAAYAQKPADKPAAQGAAAQTAPQSGRPKPESVNDRASYIIGYNLGKSMKQQDVTANTDLVMQGLRDGMGGGQAMLSDQEMQEAMTAFQKELFACGNPVLIGLQGQWWLEGSSNSAGTSSTLNSDPIVASWKITALLSIRSITPRKLSSAPNGY